MRVYEWFDVDTLTTKYSIQQNNGYGVWTHIVTGDHLLLLDTKDEAKQFIKHAKLGEA